MRRRGEERREREDGRRAMIRGLVEGMDWARLRYRDMEMGGGALHHCVGVVLGLHIHLANDNRLFWS